MWEKLWVVVACRIIVLSPGPGLCYSQRFSEILWLTLNGPGLDMDLDRRLQYLDKVHYISEIHDYDFKIIVDEFSHLVCYETVQCPLPLQMSITTFPSILLNYYWPSPFKTNPYNTKMWYLNNLFWPRESKI